MPQRKWRILLWCAFGTLQVIVFSLQVESATEGAHPWWAAFLVCLSILVEVLAVKLLAFLLRCHFGWLRDELKGRSWWTRVAVNFRKAWQTARTSALCQWTVSVADGYIATKQCEQYLSWVADGANGAPPYAPCHWMGVVDIDGGWSLGLSHKARLQFSCVGTSIRPFLSPPWRNTESILNVPFLHEGREYTFLFIRRFLGKWEGLAVHCATPEEFFPAGNFVTPCMRLELPSSGYEHFYLPRQ